MDSGGSVGRRRVQCGGHRWGHRAAGRDIGYHVVGKTSPVDRAVNGRYNGTYTSSFAGLAPCQQPADRDVVVLQSTDKKDHFGGSAAGPVFKTITSFAMGSRHVALTDTPLTPPPVTGNRPS